MADGAVTGRDAELLEQAEVYSRGRVGTGPAIVGALAGRLRLALAVVEAARESRTVWLNSQLGPAHRKLDAALAAFEGSLPATEEEGAHDG